MHMLTLLQRASFISLLVLALQPAHAAEPNQMDDMYAKMCVSAADMPKPHGEWDLKGNPKLQQYCGCFSELFAARAMKAAQAMQQNGGKPRGTLEEHTKEELAMRNACRKKVSLPEVPGAK